MFARPFAPTRQTKNRVMVLANAVLWLLLLAAAVWGVSGIGWVWAVWMGIVPVVSVWALRRPAPEGKPIHLALFFLTGFAVGVTIANVIAGELSWRWARVAWLVLGIGAAALHYWPSPSDPYTGDSSI